jgi:hypothetical protein
VIEDVLDEQDMVLPVRRLADDGLKAWQQVIERGYEGLVAKDPASPHVGGRTLKWLKVKQQDYRVEERGWDSRNRIPAMYHLRMTRGIPLPSHQLGHEDRGPLVLSVQARGQARRGADGAEIHHMACYRVSRR